MSRHAQQVPGKSWQNSSEAATASETVKDVNSVHSTANTQRIPAWAMALGDALPPGLVLQTKLTVSQPGEPYEQEADRISQQVMRRPEPQLQHACTCGGVCSKCQTEQPGQEHERLQTKRVQASDTGQIAAPPVVHEVLRSPGQPLGITTQEFMESRFGHDFSHVRVHTDAKAAESSRALNAQAYTVGRDIVFAPEQYQPATTSGRGLLAHELAHVVQQSHTPAPRLQPKVVDDNEHLPCRATAGRDAATLTARENEAATMAENAATALRARPLAEATRRLLWKRFRLDYNDALARCRFIPTIADRLARIARDIRNVEVTYHCTATGEPSSDCPGNFAYTRWGPFGGRYIDLCSSFWTLLPPEKAETLLHEWSHYDFGIRGVQDELPGGFDTAECYSSFALEVGSGVAGPAEDAGCVPNPDPLPALDSTRVAQPCPTNVFVNLSVTGGYAYGLPRPGHYSTLGGGLDLLFPLTLMHDWELSVGAHVLRLAPTDPNERAAFMFGVRTGLQFRYRPWRFGWQAGGYAEAGGINVPDVTGVDRTHAYVGGGLTGGLNIPLGRQTALQLFLDVGAMAGFDTQNSTQFGLFHSGLNAVLQFQ